MEALRLTPAYKDYLWGGQKLKKEYGKKSDLPLIAESWELSLNDAGLSKVAGTGKTLREWLAAERDPASEAGRDFPILVKLIDAKQDLSVQVHPDDGYARSREGQAGKTEMWYVVDHDEGAALYIGFKRDTTRAEVAEAVRENRLETLLRKINVRKGDVYFIPAGTVHAIGKGNLLAEVQQNSDVTYRIYDYGRTGGDGKRRELHLEKALDVVNLTAAAPVTMIRELVRSDDACRETLVNSCEHFTVYHVETVTEAAFLSAAPGRFELLLFLKGPAFLEYDGGTLRSESGESIFIPAGPGRYRVSGGAEFLRIFGANAAE